MAPKKFTIKRARKTVAGEGPSTTSLADFEFNGH